MQIEDIYTSFGKSVILYSTVMLVSYNLYYIFSNLGKKIIFIELVPVMAAIQWVLAPLFIEIIDNPLIERYKIENIKTESVYISYAYFSYIVVYIFFLLKDSIRINKISFSLEKLSLKNYKINASIGKRIVVLSLLSFLFNQLTSIPVLSVVASFTAALLPVGIIILNFSNYKYKYLFLFLFIIFSVWDAMMKAMFFKLFINMTFVFMFLDLKIKTRKLYKIALGVLIIPLLVFLQIAKKEYRKSYWNSDKSQIASLSNAIEESSDQAESSNSRLELLIPLFQRLNQGYIDGKVFKEFPENQSFKNGETIVKSFVSVLVPRIFWENKYGYDNRKVKELANHKVKKNVFFTVSIMAETYANFGFIGGLLFFIFFSFLIKEYYLIILSKAINQTTLAYFAPIIFLTVFRTEIDYFQIFSNIINSSILVFFVAVFVGRLHLLFGFKNRL